MAKASKVSTEDNLAVAIAQGLNSKFQKELGTVAYTEGTQSPSDVSAWISTGCDMLDLAISNRKNGGLPVGRIIEITGLEGSGKSLLAAHVLAETQKMGGLAVYIDTEVATSRAFFEAIGIDFDKMLYISMFTLEDIFETVETIISKVRDSSRDRIVTIVVDSVMGSTTKIENAADYDKDGYATQKAIIISKAMRKITGLIGTEKICLIFTNQLRVKMGVSFGDPYTTSGGKALPFHASVRLRLKSMGQIKVGSRKDNVEGVKTQCKIIKNRLGPPLKTIDYDIYFSSGIDNYGSWLKTMKDYGLVKQAGAWYTYQFGDQEVKFQSKTFMDKLNSIDGLRDEIYSKIADSYILQYTPSVDFGIDDIEIDSEFEREES